MSDEGPKRKVPSEVSNGGKIVTVYFDNTRYVELSYGQSLHSACEEYTYWTPTTWVLLHGIFEADLKSDDYSSAEKCARQMPRLENGDIDMKSIAFFGADSFRLDPKKKWHVVPFGILSQVLHRFILESPTSSCFMASYFQEVIFSNARTIGNDEKEMISVKPMKIKPCLTYNVTTIMEYLIPIARVSNTVFVMMQSNSPTIYCIKKDPSDPVGVFGYLSTRSSGTRFIVQPLFAYMTETFGPYATVAKFPHTFEELMRACGNSNEMGVKPPMPEFQHQLMHQIPRIFKAISGRQINSITMINDDFVVFEDQHVRFRLAHDTALGKDEDDSNNAVDVPPFTVVSINRSSHPGRLEIQRYAMRDGLFHTYLVNYQGKIQSIHMNSKMLERSICEWTGPFVIYHHEERGDEKIAVLPLRVASPTQENPDQHDQVLKFVNDLKQNAHIHLSLDLSSTPVTSTKDFKGDTMVNPSRDGFRLTGPVDVAVYKFQYNGEYCCVMDTSLGCVRLWNMKKYFQKFADWKQIPPEFLQPLFFAVGSTPYRIDNSQDYQRQDELAIALYRPSQRGRMLNDTIVNLQNRQKSVGKSASSRFHVTAESTPFEYGKQDEKKPQIALTPAQEEDEKYMKLFFPATVDVDQDEKYSKKYGTHWNRKNPVDLDQTMQKKIAKKAKTESDITPSHSEVLKLINEYNAGGRGRVPVPVSIPCSVSYGPGLGSNGIGHSSVKVKLEDIETHAFGLQKRTLAEKMFYHQK